MKREIGSRVVQIVDGARAREGQVIGNGEGGSYGTWIVKWDCGQPQVSSYVTIYEKDCATERRVGIYWE